MIIPVNDRLLVEPVAQQEDLIPDFMKKDGLRWCRVIHNGWDATIKDGDLVLVAVQALRKGYYEKKEFMLIASRDVWAYIKKQTL